MDQKIISIYDYVFDVNNFVYVVRSDLGDVVQAKLLYTCQTGMWNKHKLYNGIYTGHLPFELGDYGDFLLKKVDIIKVISPFEVDLSYLPAKVKAVCDTIILSGATVKLFGSRLLGNNKINSDWDIIIQSDLNPVSIMNSIAKNNSEFRRFSINELRSRMIMYGQEIICSNQEYLKYLSEATLYLKYGEEELGVFFQRMTPHEGINHNDITNFLEETICIQIDYSNGQSFYMPRMVKGTDQQGKTICIFSTKWGLQGLEVLAGKTLQFSGNWVNYQRGLKWFGGNDTTIKIL